MNYAVVYCGLIPGLLSKLINVAVDERAWGLQCTYVYFGCLHSPRALPILVYGISLQTMQRKFGACANGGYQALQKGPGDEASGGGGKSP